MLSRLQIILDKPTNNQLNFNITLLLQGALMEQISYEFTLELHNGSRQPYSQYVEFGQEQIIWNIQTLIQTAYEQILVPMMHENVQSIYIRHKDLELGIGEKRLEQCSYDQLRKEWYFTDGSRIQTIQFVSPTAFKSQGEYIFYPSVHFLFQSLMMKYDACSDDADLFGSEITIMINGLQALVNLADYLLAFGEYSDVGIKSGLGWEDISWMRGKGGR